MGKDKVCFNGNCFEVDLAITEEERKEGLMFKESLDSDKGLLFVFGEEKESSFWMKNVSFPLDIIWIDKDKKVVHISKNTPPCQKEPCPRFKSGKKAKYVLEINGGLADKIGISLGDKADISY